MKVNIEQLQIGITNYVEQEIAKKAVGFQKFTTYFAIVAYQNRIPTMLMKLKDNTLIKTLGVYDEDNNVDIDIIYNYAKEAIKHSGQFTLMGIIFNENDIDKLYNYIKQTTI